MKEKAILVCLLFIATFSFAQSIGRSVISSVGGIMNSSDINVSFTIGEPVVGLVANNNSVDQGFWAGNGILIIPLNIEEEDDIIVYPNPVIEHVVVAAPKSNIYGIELFAVNGQRVSSQIIEAEKTEYEIDMTYFSNGVYVLKLYLEGGLETQEYKLIKK